MPISDKRAKDLAEIEPPKSMERIVLFVEALVEHVGRMPTGYSAGSGLAVRSMRRSPMRWRRFRGQDVTRSSIARLMARYQVGLGEVREFSGWLVRYHDKRREMEVIEDDRVYQDLPSLDTFAVYRVPPPQQTASVTSGTPPRAKAAQTGPPEPAPRSASMDLGQSAKAPSSRPDVLSRAWSETAVQRPPASAPVTAPPLPVWVERGVWGGALAMGGLYAGTMFARSQAGTASLPPSLSPLQPPTALGSPLTYLVQQPKVIHREVPVQMPVAEPPAVHLVTTKASAGPREPRVAGRPATEPTTGKGAAAAPAVIAPAEQADRPAAAAGRSTPRAAEPGLAQRPADAVIQRPQLPSNDAAPIVPGLFGATAALATLRQLHIGLLSTAAITAILGIIPSEAKAAHGPFAAPWPGGPGALALRQRDGWGPPSAAYGEGPVLATGGEPSITPAAAGTISGGRMAAWNSPTGRIERAGGPVGSEPHQAGPGIPTRRPTRSQMARLGLLTIVSPSLSVSSADPGQSSVAVAFDWKTLAAGAGPLDASGLARLREVLPPGAQAIYPALPATRLGPSAVNLTLAPSLARELAGQAYGVRAVPVSAAGSEPDLSLQAGSSSVAPLPGRIVPSRRPAGEASAIFGGQEESGAGSLAEAGHGQARRGGVLDFLGLPIRLAPSLGGKPELRDEVASRSPAAEQSSSRTILPKAFDPLRKRLFPRFQSVEAEPDEAAWNKAAPSFGLRSGSKATVLAPDARVQIPTATSPLPQTGVGVGAKRAFGLPASLLGPLMMPLAADAGAPFTSAAALPGSPSAAVAAFPGSSRLTARPTDSTSWSTPSHFDGETPRPPTRSAGRPRFAVPLAHTTTPLLERSGFLSPQTDMAETGHLPALGGYPDSSAAGFASEPGRAGRLLRPATGRYPWRQSETVPGAALGDEAGVEPLDTSGPPSPRVNIVPEAQGPARLLSTRLAAVSPGRAFGSTLAASEPLADAGHPDFPTLARIPQRPVSHHYASVLQRVPAMAYATPTKIGGQAVHVQRSASAGDTPAGGAAATPDVKPKAAPKEDLKQRTGAAQANVQLLANEVWSLLKRRLSTEADRRGRY